jgi:hypothetical protein
MKPRISPPWPKKGEAPRLVSLLEVLAQAGISASTWGRLGGRPLPVIIGQRSVRYWSDEVDRFLEALPRTAA